MKKAAFLICLIFILGLTRTSFAGAGKIESPNINVVIDGKQIICSNAPIMVNGRTLLPLTDILKNLGVQNDNKHILWDSKKRSVTILKGKDKISLQVDNKSVLVNGNKKVLDVAPLIYNKIVYIPAKFIAESFNKKVLWNKTNSSIIIYDQSEFNKVKDIILKADGIIKNSKTYKYALNYAIELDSKHAQREEYIINSEVDMKNKAVHLLGINNTRFNDTNQSYSFENYLSDGFIYTKNESYKDWTKSKLQGSLEETEFIKKELYYGVLGEFLSDCDLAGLIVKNNPNSDVIILEGDIFSCEVESEPFRSYKPHTKITINKETYMYQEKKVQINYTTHDGGKYSGIETFNGYEINGQYDFTVPEEAINAKLLELEN